MKQKVIKIKLSSLISKSISSRQAIKLIEDKIFILPNYDKIDIILDFSSVNFISRSFTDEILNLKEKLENRKISFEFIETNDEINKMLEITSFHRTIKPKREIDLKAVDLEKVIYQF